MQKRDFGFKIKSFDDSEGTFEGDLAVYGNVDLGGDVIQPNAFKRSIANQGNTVPLLWQHKQDEPIGVLELIDTPSALRVKGKLLMELPMAQKAHVLLKSRIVRGLSVGYDTIKEDFKDGVRYLEELRLWEGSVVTFPMNENAVITGVKQDGSPDDDEQEELAALQQVFDSLQALAAILQR
jgi:HK97 family phage prohead protease